MKEFGASYDDIAADMARNLREYCFAVGCLYCVFRVQDDTNDRGACAIRRPRDGWHLENILNGGDEKKC